MFLAHFRHGIRSKGAPLLGSTFHGIKYQSSQAATSELFTENDSLAEIRHKLRALGQGSIDFVPDYQPGIGLVTLNNPVRHNAMSGIMMSQLADLTDKLEAQPNDLVGLIVTGAMPSKAFCAGLGIKAPQDSLRRSSLFLTNFFFSTGFSIRSVHCQRASLIACCRRCIWSPDA